MRKNISNKKLLYSASIFIVVFCISFFLKSNSSSTDSSVNTESIVPSYGVQSADNQDVPDRTEKEPIYMSIFKLIVNCNPFKEKKAQQ
jgi:hypothetical protein